MSTEQSQIEEMNHSLFSNLMSYNPEPLIRIEDFSPEEIQIIIEVLERNSKVEFLDKLRIRKLKQKSSEYLSQYSNAIRDRCRFCSSIEVYMLNPLYTCVRCMKLVCITCHFIILWDDNEKVICAHCLCSVIVDNRANKWFQIISEINNRKRVSPKIYIQQILQKVKKKTKNNENEWIPMEDAIAKMNYEEIKEFFSLKMAENSVQDENAQISELLQSKTSRQSSTNLDTPNETPPQTISLSIDYFQKDSNFEIFICHCQNLPLVKDKQPNTYIKLDIEPQYLQNKKKPKTKIIKENSNPIINEKLKIRISQNKITNGNLIVLICSFNKMSKDSVLGEVIIPINQTLLNNKGNILTYKIKPLETPISSMADKKILISRLMENLSKPQYYYEKVASNWNEPDKEMFEMEPELLTKIKCEMTKSSNFDILVHLDSLNNIHKLLESSSTVLIAALLKDNSDTEISNTGQVSVFINSPLEILTVNYQLLFGNLDNNLDFDSLQMQLELYINEKNMIAYSYNSIAHVLKKMKSDLGIWFPINFKMRRTQSNNNINEFD